jgi:hypothetical protein
MNAFNQLSPQINTFNSDASVFEKKQSSPTITSHSSSITYLPPFVIQEMNNNPECYEVSKQDHRLDSEHTNLPNWKGNKVGIIKPINPKQLLIDIFSLTVFPFAAQMLVKNWYKFLI